MRRHPVDSQRSLIWAVRFGKQEELVDVLARKHFEEATSVSHRPTLLAAATEALSAFLDSEEGVAAVWQSYGDTVGKHNIHSIPFFVFNGPSTNGGPFRSSRPGGGPGGHTVRGSANVDEFVHVFEQILAAEAQAEAAAALRGNPAPPMRAERPRPPPSGAEQRIEAPMAT